MSFVSPVLVGIAVVSMVAGMMRLPFRWLIALASMLAVLTYLAAR